MLSSNTALSAAVVRNHQSDTTSARSFKGLAESLTIFIAIPALTLYPLGFVSLWIQMMSAPFFPYGLDREMAWYAASLVDRIVVIGTGVHVLFLSLAATGLVGGVLFFLDGVLRRRRQIVQDLASTKRWTLVRSLLFIMLGVGLGLYVFWANNLLARITVIDYPLPGDAKSIFRMFCLLGALLLILVIASSSAYIVRKNGRPSYRVLAVGYVGVVLAASLLAGSEYPSLPVVQFYRPDAAAAEDYYFSYDPYQNNRPTYVLLSSREEGWYVVSPAEGLLAINPQLNAVSEFHAVDEDYAGIYKVNATCHDFDTQTAAQGFYNVLANDFARARMDPDEDGEACEGLETP